MKTDRRLSSFYGPDLTKPVKKSNLPVRICLISAVSLLMMLLLFIMYTGSAVLYIHFWVYPAVVGLIAMLFLGAAAFAIYNRCESQRASRNAAILLIGFMVMVGMAIFSVCSLFTNMWRPVGFFDSPEGENRIVVMRSQADQGSLIEAYPAIGNHFYVAGMESEKVLSNGVISGVEWEGERLAKVYLEDVDGNDTELVVDFSILYAGEADAAE